MPASDARLERDLAGYVTALERALGDALVGINLYGSAATDDWVRGASDVNTIVVVRAVTSQVLDTLAACLPAWRRKGFALPLIVEEDFFERAADAFPMELDDARRVHRTLRGPDLLTAVRIDRAQLRRQCEQEARGKLARLRARYLDAAARPADVEELLTRSLTSFLVILRHLLHLRGDDTAFAYTDVLAAGEHVLGPLPAFRRILERRRTPGRRSRGEIRDEFARYLGDAERVVAAVDTLRA
jgi:predicted nucleotidyltransferase